MAQHNQVKTHETWLHIEGTAYRQIEVNGKFYYLKLKRDETKPEAELRCDLLDYPPPKEIMDSQEPASRSKEFVARLESTCGKSKGSRTIALDSSFIPLIESFDDGVIKNKELRMGITPGRTNPGMQVKKKF
jgi:hypothetical protein